MDKKCNFDVSESKLIYKNNITKIKIFTKLITKIFTLLLLIAIMFGIGYGFFKLFKLNPECSIDQKISYCSAIITFACAIITISTLMADRQIRIYNDSLNIFNELNSQKHREHTDESIQTVPLHMWYFIKKIKIYKLKYKKKLYSQISDANITFYFDKECKYSQSEYSLTLNIPLTRAEWQFFIVVKNCLRMLYYQKSYLYNLYCNEDEIGLLMWETVLSLYKSVMINVTMNLIRLINVLCIPIVIIIACIA